jgi:hypothetical protein
MQRLVNRRRLAYRLQQVDVRQECLRGVPDHWSPHEADKLLRQSCTEAAAASCGYE